VRCLFEPVVVFCLFALVLPPQLQAQAPGGTEITWQGPASCPRRVQFDAQLERLLSGRSRERTPSVAHVQVGEVGLDGFELRLTIDAPHGRSERNLTVATCAQAQHAAALLIASAIDLDEDTPAESSYPRAAPEVQTRYLLRLGSIVDVGSLPAATVGPSLGLFLSRAMIRGWAEARYVIPRRARDNDSTLVADLDLFAAVLGVARLWKVGPLAIGPCVELELGALRARAEGELEARTRTTLWLGASAGALLSYPRTGRPVADLGLALLASVPWLRQPFSLGDDAPFYTTSVAAFRLALWLAFDVRPKN
jgi:hypothetical protein